VDAAGGTPVAAESICQSCLPQIRANTIAALCRELNRDVPIIAPLREKSADVGCVADLMVRRYRIRRLHEAPGLKSPRY